MASNIITINRGDSFEFNLYIEDKDTESGLYFLDTDDVVYLGVMMPRMTFEDALIKRKYNYTNQEKDGSIVVKITPSDTLDLEPGVYYYSVKLVQNVRTEQEEVKTVINKTKFVVND